MTDNVTITAGLGTTIAADDVGGVLHQRVKAVWGPDGTANDTDVATGKSFPVQLRSATGLIPLGEPTDAKSTATDTTSTSGISIWKQISASVQAVATAVAATLSTKPASLTVVSLDVKTVSTGGTAVTALTAGHRSAGGWIKNPESAAVNLGINEIDTAVGTTSSGNTTFIVPGVTYVLAPSGNAVSVISSDSSHPFSGMGYT